MLQNTPEAFAAQLRDGHYNELRVALFYMLAGFHVRIGFQDGRFDIDLRHPRRPPRKVEVKWDKRASDSGNLYFEVENTRRRCPSGIMATGADVWAHVLGEGQEAFLVTVPALRKFLQDGRFRSVQTSGTDSNSRGVLVPLAAIPGEGPFRRVRLPTVEEYFGEIYRRGTSCSD
ncbi:MAG: hypothetical protein HY319_09140 [Armatimonadetes bacterium]|nr:hypothetical protein [Armatimonadota bacterium]